MFVGDVVRYVCVMKLWLCIEVLECLLQNENISLLGYAESCDGLGDVVPVPW